jgi:hypothetical protein
VTSTQTAPPKEQATAGGGTVKPAGSGPATQNCESSTASAEMWDSSTGRVLNQTAWSVVPDGAA